MLLETSIVLTIASIATEFIIVTKFPIIKEALMKSSLMSLGFSTGLSWLVGFLFEASGLTVLVSALVSTIISWLIYRGADFVSVKTKQLVTI